MKNGLHGLKSVIFHFVTPTGNDVSITENMDGKRKMCVTKLNSRKFNIIKEKNATIIEYPNPHYRILINIKYLFLIDPILIIVRSSH